MKLINSKRTNNLVFLTFAYKYPAVEILDNNKMLFYITASHDIDNNWTICDFDYNYNLNDYYNWLSEKSGYVNKLIDK
ncbi:hypothetical protein KAT63_05100 [Candidatus Parcubacteria bacterium]|nr:hypothetical protein [Candidatus Parcubacteria bacterium]